jgi:hypothetical protein
LPEISVIWYFDFWLFRWSTPGWEFVDFSFCCLFFLLLLFLDPFAGFAGKKRSLRLVNEYGEIGASMIASQMIASESRGFSFAGEAAG